jgi:hypothetical protein
MIFAEFSIGCEFTTMDGKHTWRCTDIGKRTIIAIRINTEGGFPIERSWLRGPPYMVAEIAFDENDILECTALTKPRTS